MVSEAWVTAGVQFTVALIEKVNDVNDVDDEEQDHVQVPRSRQGRT